MEVESIIDGMTATEFLEWLVKREVYLEGPGRGNRDLVFMKVRDLRSQAMFEGSGRTATAAIMSALGFLFDERREDEHAKTLT